VITRKRDGNSLLSSAEAQAVALETINTDPIKRKYLDQIRNNAGPYTDPDAIAPESLDRFETMKLL
jgi:hypothetical protein